MNSAWKFYWYLFSKLFFEKYWTYTYLIKLNKFHLFNVADLRAFKEIFNLYYLGEYSLYNEASSILNKSLYIKNVNFVNKFKHIKTSNYKIILQYNL